MKDSPFWSLAPGALAKELDCGTEGLSAVEARRRIAAQWPNRLRPRASASVYSLLLAQFRNPITVLMVIAAVISVFLGEKTEGILILAILAMSGLLGFWQEKRAADTVGGLLGMLKVKARAIRDGAEVEIGGQDVVPGDKVRLEAGSAVPGDALILDSQDLFVDESALTGESFPAEKAPGALKAEAVQHERSNSAFLGTHVVSGMATVLVAAVGDRTQFGGISRELNLRAPETAFERGTKHFGYLLLEAALIQAS